MTNGIIHVKIWWENLLLLLHLLLRSDSSCLTIRLSCYYVDRLIVSYFICWGLLGWPWIKCGISRHSRSLILRRFITETPWTIIGVLLFNKRSCSLSWLAKHWLFLLFLLRWWFSKSTLWTTCVINFEFSKVDLRSSWHNFLHTRLASMISIAHLLKRLNSINSNRDVFIISVIGRIFLNLMTLASHSLTRGFISVLAHSVNHLNIIY